MTRGRAFAWGGAALLLLAGGLTWAAESLGWIGRFPWAEAAALAGVVAVVAATAWLPPVVLRVLGPIYAALLVFVFVRTAAGAGWAIGSAAVTVVVAAAFFPLRVHRRLSFMVPSLVLLVLVTTILMFGAPGSPFAQEKVASEQVTKAKREAWGVPDRAIDFFAVYMERLLVDGSLGPSLKVQGRTVQELILPALPVSMTLGLLALLIATALGLLLGIRAGLRPSSAADYGSMALAMVGISLPNFVIGSALMIVFALVLRWLPVAGWGGYEHLWLPAVTLALPYAAYIARLARAGTIEVMQQDFIRTARAKGLPERAVVLKHAFRGAIVPVVSFLGPAAAGILTGSFVVETLFAVPGMGQYFVRGALNRDYSVVLGTALVYCTLVTLFNLAVDFAYAWLDPRVRSET